MSIEKILKDKKQNNKNSKFKSTDFQEIYSFWLDNSVNSNQSAYNMKPINKWSKCHWEESAAQKRFEGCFHSSKDGVH